MAFLLATMSLCSIFLVNALGNNCNGIQWPILQEVMLPRPSTKHSHKHASSAWGYIAIARLLSAYTKKQNNGGFVPLSHNSRALRRIL